MKKIYENTLKIGSKIYEDALVIPAPMAGYTDLPFRIICEENGANLTFTEMINAKALCYGDTKTLSMLDISGQKKDVAVQIFGSEVEYMKEAVKILCEMNKFSHIDINMGCPAPKIVKNGDGSALMNLPSLASKIVSEVKKVSKLPITVKIRKGTKTHFTNAPEFAKRMQDSGADAITVHGRSAQQYYTGKADWDIIKYIKHSLTIPVIGNGDVSSPEKALEMLEYTQCNAVLVGRACQGNPFILKQIQEFLAKKEYNPVSDYEKISTAIKHYTLALRQFGENVAVREMRKQLNSYLKGMPNSAYIKNQINTELSANKVLLLLKGFLRTLQ